MELQFSQSPDVRRENAYAYALTLQAFPQDWVACTGQRDTSGLFPYLYWKESCSWSLGIISMYTLQSSSTKKESEELMLLKLKKKAQQTKKGTSNGAINIFCGFTAQFTFKYIYLHMGFEGMLTQNVQT